jgi:diguanylate cyclase (GGDEF)-like protein
MKFLSIFSGREVEEPDGAPSEARAQNATKTVEPAIRAAKLLGVPGAHMTREVRAALNALMGEIDVLRDEQAEMRDKLAEAEAAADHDPLAPVYNRRAFMRETSRVIAMVRRHEVEAALIFFDLNGFKEINDNHGHAAGDSVLRSIGETLIKHTRETDIVGRIGGDEFGVVLTHLSGDAARAKAESLAAAIRTERLKHDGVTLEVSAAFGMAGLNGQETAERLLARADEAMYADKALHRRARA